MARIDIISTEHQRRTYSVEQAAQLLGISRSTAYECARNGALPCLHFRRRIVIPALVIDEMLESRHAEGGRETRESA
jgi:excisionase family DNA binding protein